MAWRLANAIPRLTFQSTQVKKAKKTVKKTVKKAKKAPVRASVRLHASPRRRLFDGVSLPAFARPGLIYCSLTG